MTVQSNPSKFNRANLSINRRSFMAGASAGAFAFTFIKPELVFGTTANSRINLGIIGCGSRGNMMAGLFKEHGGYNIAAVADYFQDGVDQVGDKFNVPANRRYTTRSI